MVHRATKPCHGFYSGIKSEIKEIPFIIPAFYFDSMFSYTHGVIVLLTRLSKIVIKVFLFPALALISCVWRLLHRRRVIYGKYEKMPIPVVCIGNVTLGGAGKTPTVIFLVDYLIKNKIKVHVVSRGYGGKFKDTVLVNPKIHTAFDVGDEPLLISQHANVWVSKKKKKGVLSAYKAGAEIVLLDDGYQNFSIVKDLNILVFDAEINLKNERVFPLGNLRESPSSAIARADFLLCVGSPISRKNLQNTFMQHHNSKIIEGKFKPNITPVLKKSKLVAFCGIGRPEKFFSMLEDLNMEVIDKIPFPDHHFYSKKQVTKILKIAERNSALVVTTEKDYVKLPASYKKVIYPINIKLHLLKRKKLLSELKSLVF